LKKKLTEHLSTKINARSARNHSDNKSDNGDVRISAIPRVQESDESSRMTDEDFELFAAPSVGGQTAKSKKTRFESTAGRGYERKNLKSPMSSQSPVIAINFTEKKKKKSKKSTSVSGKS